MPRSRTRVRRHKTPKIRIFHNRRLTIDLYFCVHNGRRSNVPKDRTRKPKLCNRLRRSIDSIEGEMKRV